MCSTFIFQLFKLVYLQIHAELGLMRFTCMVLDELAVHMAKQ